jgi:N-acetylmuramoyl-L-alanine amidase
MLIQFDHIAEAIQKAHEFAKQNQGSAGTAGAKTLKHLVIHCTATPEGRIVTPADIKRWHTAPISQGGRGWAQVGYSDIILLNGSLENLVPWDLDPEVDPWELTNGVKGINSVARHIVYVGGTDTKGKAKDTRNLQQSETLKNYCQMAVSLWPQIKISGHNQHDRGKACPSFDVAKYLKSIGIHSQHIF